MDSNSITVDREFITGVELRDAPPLNVSVPKDVFDYDAAE
jgi:hypothetical protein